MSEKLVTRWIPIPLTEKELVEFGNRASEIHTTLAHTRFEAKESADSFKDRIGGLQDDLNDVMKKLRDKKEVRQTKCLEVMDFANKKVNYLLGDEIVETRPLTEADMQMPIF